MNFFKSHLMTYLVPKNLNVNWNFGFLLGMMFMLQSISGFLLSFFYEAAKAKSFDSVHHINSDANIGWFIRYFHSMGVSVYFILMFFHIIKGLWFSSKCLPWSWYTGIIVLILSIGEAFIGYVLPDGQMSFWGSTVIINLLKFFGRTNVIIFGGFEISEATLHRFYIFHVYTPVAIFAVLLIHIFYLHRNSSTNPLSFSDAMKYMNFFQLSVMSDLKSMVTLISLVGVQAGFGQIQIFQADPDNSVLSNTLSTPPHIIPEWYLLLFYATLKVFPTKTSGLVAVLSVLEFLAVLVEARSFTSLLATFFFHRVWSVVSIGVVPFLFMLGCLGKMVINFGLVFLGLNLVMQITNLITKFLDSSRVRC